MTRALSIILIAIALPQAALAAHGANTPPFPRGASLGGLLKAHMAPEGTPTCHYHDDGTPFHCSCDGLFNLLCPDHMKLGKAEGRPSLPANLITPNTPAFKLDQ